MKILTLLFILLISCKSVPSYASIKLPEITDAATIDFLVDAVAYDGFASVAGKRSYIMNFKIPEKTMMFSIRTCHREKFLPVTDKQTAVTYNYSPVDGLENNETLCNMVATAITSTGQKIWAYINFVYPRNSDVKNLLTSYIFCDGLVSSNVGGGVCQQRAGKPAVRNSHGDIIEQEQEGSVQKITMSHPVIFADSTNPRCGKPKATQDGMKFEIETKAGTCVYLFGDKDGATFRLITLGYLGKTP